MTTQESTQPPMTKTRMQLELWHTKNLLSMMFIYWLGVEKFLIFTEFCKSSPLRPLQPPPRPQALSSFGAAIPSVF